MNLKIYPLEKIQGEVSLPASKSYSIRAFIIAACGGLSTIMFPSDCDDAKAAMMVAKAFGARVRKIKDGYAIDALVRKNARFCASTIDVAESGTSLRFVLPLLPFYAQIATVVGKGTLVGRPNKHLCESLRSIGLNIRGDGDKESVPIRYTGGKISGGRVVIDGSVSSQFVSALLIALPRVAEDTRLIVSGKMLVSQDYVIMTRQILEKAGVTVTPKGPREFQIPGGQEFKGLKDFHVPSDDGLAAFFMSAAAIMPSHIVLKGHFDHKLVQSDSAILPFLKKMGVRFTRTDATMRLNGPFALKGGVFSLKNCPDLVPIMAVTAMFAKGITRLKDIGHARVKESDRITDLRKELQKVGADITEKNAELIIRPKAVYKTGVTLDPHHDHRLAMAFAILGLRIGVTVKDMECTAKSYPGFVKAFKTLT
ncbi:MAG: 3-phosphoshikimate 1-carboxyvinyltransferase [Candidatus Omnitrophica bacterium]|nr:3-phosphoshikimate 1-carboxyvinyltransferase [Candidatus Omnitrophota bacterium]